jgi:precorrin-2 dehydrogenase
MEWAKQNGDRSQMDLFPIMVKLQGRRCIVVGAGEIAASKISALLAAGARVAVVAPEAIALVRELAKEQKLAWQARAFVAADVENAFLAVAATDSSAVNESVFRACAERGVLCNVVDDPERCDFFYPAVVRRGALQIAISTGGHSPALAHRLRVELEHQFGAEYEGWLEEVGRARRDILAGNLPEDERQRLLEQIASRDEYEKYVARRAGNAPEAQAAPATRRET